MRTHTLEQALRREAIRRRLAGARRKEICAALDRSTGWFDKWWAEFRRNPQTDFADRSRAPHYSPHQTPPEMVRTIVALRRTLEAATTPQTRYGLVGARALQGQLQRLSQKAPSRATIQRILRRAGLTQPLGAGQAAAYYPWPQAWRVNAIHATDIITRHLHGGEVIQNFHTIDHWSHRAFLSQHADKSSATSVSHLLASWKRLGRPQFQQLDNEAAFSAGTTHPHVLGQVVRLCLFCGIEPVFTPFYEPKRNYQIETFHSLWDRAVWSRQSFRNRAQVQAELPRFERWYHTVYQPPILGGKTPAQMRSRARGAHLSVELQRLIPPGRLPLTAGRVHFLRRVDASGAVEVLNERWTLGARWGGAYVRATINTQEQVITIWHQSDSARPWRLLRKRPFRLSEQVQPLHPAFLQNRTRCREYWPG